MGIKSYEKTLDITVYETSDGKTFHFEHQAEYHEESLWSAKVRKHLVRMIVEHPFERILSRHWTMIRNENEMEYVISKLGNPHYINDEYHLNDRGDGARSVLSLGDWVAEYENDGDDEGGFWTLSFLYSKMKELIEEIEEKTVEGKF